MHIRLDNYWSVLTTSFMGISQHYWQYKASAVAKTLVKTLRIFHEIPLSELYKINDIVTLNVRYSFFVMFC